MEILHIPVVSSAVLLLPALFAVVKGQSRRAAITLVLAAPPICVLSMIYASGILSPSITAFGPVDELLKDLAVRRVRYVFGLAVSALPWMISTIGLVRCSIRSRSRSASEETGRVYVRAGL